MALVCVSAIANGFWSAKRRTMIVVAPQLARPLAATVDGLVLSVGARLGGGARIDVRPRSIERVSVDAVPTKIRLTIGNAGMLMAGDTITVKALL